MLVLASLATGLPATRSLGAGTLQSLFAPKAELWPRWTAHDPTASARIDHSAWDAFLGAYVRTDKAGVNRVAYGRVTAADIERLDRYLADLQAVDIDRHNRAEQMAYWINLYNALTVRLVLRHYPVDSIRDIDISPGLFADGPWGKKIATVAGEQLSLDDIEHRILRPIWRDPRIHYAVTCAAVGCPDLRAEAYRGEGLDAMLDEQARDYVNDVRGFEVKEHGGLVVSNIYLWFREDFGGDDEGVLRHLRAYASAERAARIEGYGRIFDGAYDWSLNDAAAAPPGS